VKSLLTPRMLDRLTRLDVNPRRAAGGGGAGDHQSGAAGVGSLFREHRPYAPGDDLRYVDWNAYGRLRSLNVKVFEKEENLDALALIDRSASMGEGPGSKLEVALRVVASLGAVGLARGAAARIHAFPELGAAQAGSLRPMYRGRRDIDAFMRALTTIPGGGTEPMGTALRSAFPRVRPRGMALVLTDFLDPAEGPGGWRRAIDYLIYRRVQVAAVHLVSPEERDPGALGAVRFVDSETGEEVVIDVDEGMRKRYCERFAQHVREVRAYLRAKEVRHVVFESGMTEGDVVRRLLAIGLIK
jgi:uncharacterized protein (DUF58 family)